MVLYESCAIEYYFFSYILKHYPTHICFEDKNRYTNTIILSSTKEKGNYSHLHRAHNAVGFDAISKHSERFQKHSRHHALFVCRLLSGVIAVTFIFAPEACLPVSITWRQTWRELDLCKCRIIGIDAELNVPERAILNLRPLPLDQNNTTVVF